MLATVENLVNDFFEKLEVPYEELKITNEQWNIYSIKIKTEQSWAMIGPHGRNIESIERILKLIISKNLDEKIKLHLEVNDYMYSKDEKLFRFIDSKITLIKNWKNDDIRLPFLNAYERKKAHSYIAELNNSKIYTKSMWEWHDRRLHICKVDEKITIDIDWDDI